MVMWNDLGNGRCSMLDACSNPNNPEDVFKLLWTNFARHYNTNRAPIGKVLLNIDIRHGTLEGAPYRDPL